MAYITYVVLDNPLNVTSSSFFFVERKPTRRESLLLTEKEEVKSPEPAKMFIIVKYADNQSLLVNPMCSVVNLLSSIKNRTGHAQNKDMLIDLSDETGEIACCCIVNYRISCFFSIFWYITTYTKIE